MLLEVRSRSSFEVTHPSVSPMPRSSEPYVRPSQRASSTRRASWLLLALAVLGAGCGGDDGSGPPAPWVGTFTLQTMHGDALPATIIDLEGAPVMLNSASLVLRANGSYTRTYVTQQVVDGTPMQPATTVCQGSYTVDAGGTEITLTEPVPTPPPTGDVVCGGVRTATLGAFGAGTLGTSDFSMLFIYAK
jgi:hypothetical protein